MATTDKAEMNGRYAKIDTNISVSNAYLIPGLNGRQGDDGRRLYLQIVDNGLPHDLTGETVELEGRDAKGVIKTSVSLEHVYSYKAGTCSFLVPGAFYQAIGDYQTAYFVIKKNDQAISTIPVAITVYEGATLMTSGESVTWFDEYNGQIQKYAKTLQDWISGSGDQIAANQKLIDSAQNSINNMVKQIQDNHLAKTTDNNDWSGSNHFTGPVTIDNLSSPAIDKQMGNIQNQFSQLSSSITGKLAGGMPKYTDYWSRDYTLGPNLARPNNQNDFALSRFELANNMAIIWGRGDIKITHNNNDNFWESSITIPWSVNSASFIIGDWHTYKGYFKPYHGMNDSNIVPISCSGTGYNNDIVSAYLLIITDK